MGFALALSGSLIRWSLFTEFRFITRLQRIVSYGLLASGALLMLLGIIACGRYEEPVAWMFAAVCFSCSSLLVGLSAIFSFWMTTNVTYRLLQLLGLGMSFAALPGTIYSTVLLTQVFRETRSKLALGTWSEWETSEERSLQAVRVLTVLVYVLQVALFAGQALLCTCVLARFPYLWCTPTWKRDSMTASWHITTASRAHPDQQSRLLK